MPGILDEQHALFSNARACVLFCSCVCVSDPSKSTAVARLQETRLRSYLTAVPLGEWPGLAKLVATEKYRMRTTPPRPPLNAVSSAPRYGDEPVGLWDNTCCRTHPLPHLYTRIYIHCCFFVPLGPFKLLTPWY